MWFWWFMLFCDLLIPALMIIAGRMMWKHPPKNINGVIGYRTARSMRNTDTWKYAQEYCGYLWWKSGWILLLFSVIVHFPLYHCSDDQIGTAGGILCMVQCVILIIPIFFTERALKRKFTDEGVRR